MMTFTSTVKSEKHTKQQPREWARQYKSKSRNLLHYRRLISISHPHVHMFARRQRCSARGMQRWVEIKRTEATPGQKAHLRQPAACIGPVTLSDRWIWPPTAQFNILQIIWRFSSGAGSSVALRFFPTRQASARKWSITTRLLASSSQITHDTNCERWDVLYCIVFTRCSVSRLRSPSLTGCSDAWREGICWWLILWSVGKGQNMQHLSWRLKLFPSDVSALLTVPSGGIWQPKPCANPDVLWCR